jgi:predicted nucleic acid-binding protein
VIAVSDSDVFIDYLQGNPRAVAALEGYNDIYLSRVTWIEVLTGADAPEKESQARGTMAEFVILELTAQIAEIAAQLRKSLHLKLPDAVILASARALGSPLLTRNERDFGRAGPDVIIPYRIT